VCTDFVEKTKGEKNFQGEGKKGKGGDDGELGDKKKCCGRSPDIGEKSCGELGKKKNALKKITGEVANLGGGYWRRGTGENVFGLAATMKRVQPQKDPSDGGGDR